MAEGKLRAHYHFPDSEQQTKVRLRNRPTIFGGEPNNLAAIKCGPVTSAGETPGFDSGVVRLREGRTAQGESTATFLLESSCFLRCGPSRLLSSHGFRVPTGGTLERGYIRRKERRSGSQARATSGAKTPVDPSAVLVGKCQVSFPPIPRLDIGGIKKEYYGYFPSFSIPFFFFGYFTFAGFVLQQSRLTVVVCIHTHTSVYAVQYPVGSDSTRPSQGLTRTHTPVPAHRAP
ncbi:hypothetical protein J6590_066441 [Homalodisca vitripennis]|nr:hypothetical protein J6590_066441 [Homalodisca vitripennis]